MALQHRDGRKKATLWNFFFLNVGFLVSIFNGLLIIPLYLHYIPSAVYGAWLATGSILTWLTIIDPGVGSVLLQRVAFAIGKNDKTELGLAINSGIIISTVLFVLSVVLGLILSHYIGGIAKINPLYLNDIIKSFRIAIWGTAFSLLSNTFTAIILAYHKTKLHGIYFNSIMIGSSVLNIILLVMHFGIYALAYTSFFRGLFILLYALILSVYLIKHNKVELKFRSNYFKSFSKVFAFTFSSKIFDTVASNIDLILISRYVGSATVTVLDLSRRPVKIVSGLTNNITQAILPSLPHLYGSGENEKFQATILRLWSLILWVSGFILGGFILFNFDLISNWVGQKFWVGNTNNVIMCIAVLLLTISYSLSNIAHSMGFIQSNSIISIVKNVTYLILMFFLAKNYGITGVLIAYLLSMFVGISYFPKKILKTVKISSAGKKQLLNDSLMISIILTICVFISFMTRVKLSWIALISFSIVYTIIYFTTLFFLSSKFKSEFLVSLKPLTSRFKLKF